MFDLEKIVEKRFGSFDETLAFVAEEKRRIVRITGYKLANDGHDTRALQHYMGHKNIMHTVRYTEMAPDRFKNFWKD
jgi:hypothetical protein